MSASTSLVPGTEPFPGYALTRPLGRGGWGEVWHARRPNNQQVALKFIACDAQFSAAQEIRGLQAIRTLRHPNLIVIDQVWCWSGYIVIAMELADGSMMDLLQVYQTEFGACIYPEHLCYYLGQAGAALDFLNTRQHMLNDQRVAVRHCDVKPSNMLVLLGQLKMADFSVSVQATSPMWYHSRAGTLTYAAPEVFQGWLSDRSDQYSLAVSYIELRTGHLPFTDTPEKFTTSYTRPAPDLSRVDSWERPILHRALDPVPQNRWPSCKEMMDHLSSAMRMASNAAR